MTITLGDIEFLSSSIGETLLERLTHEDLSDANTLRLLTALRKDYAPEQAGAALEMARLSVKAVDKFGDDARRLFFTRSALEQASDPLVRRYRADNLIPEGYEGIFEIVDAGCGIGADSLAFASAGANVLGVDIDPVRIEIARYNAAALGLDARFEVDDIRKGIPDANMAFFDPARRDERGNRLANVEAYIPPLSTIQSWKQGVIVVKLSPGVDLAELKSYGWLVKFISVNGELKEAVMIGGKEFRGYGLSATLLIGDQDYHWNNLSHGYAPVDLRIPISQPRGWLIEPDPAILRAGLVQDVAANLNGFMLDETIAYFTTDMKPESPWVRAWQILDWLPFNLKKLRAYLRERNVGTVTVKKRGSPLTPETLIPQLKLKGSESRTLVLTRLQGQPIVMVCLDLPAH